MILTENIIEYWFINIMKGIYYWIRFEFQKRQHPHDHGLGWMPEPDGGIVKLAEICKAGNVLLRNGPSFFGSIANF